MSSFNEDILVYEVKPGDSLSGIAAHFGYVTPTQLARINRLSLIGCGLPPVFPGQKLRIPIISKDSAETVKLRRAPGAALRVRCTSEVPSTVSVSPSEPYDIDPDFYTVRPRSHYTGLGTLADSSERQFVKVTAQRAMPSGELIDGVLLITPDSLFFDATRTACAQKQAYAAAHASLLDEEAPVNQAPDAQSNVHPDVDTSPNSSPQSPKAMEMRIPESLLQLGLCLPLDRITAMSTLKTLRFKVQRRDTTSSFSSGRKASNDSVSASITETENKNGDYTAANGDDLRQQPRLLDSTKEESEKALQDELIAEAADSGNRSPSSLVASSPDLDAMELHEQEPASCSSLQATDGLFLRLVESITTEADQGTEMEHHFLISIEKIAEVFAFLMRAGVGSMREKLSRKDSTDTENPLHSSDISSNRRIIEVRRSLIEEALESIESSPLLPQLFAGSSIILSESMLSDLGANFPSHWVGSNLQLVYSTEQDGYSLNTLYRKCMDVEGGVVLVIQDTIGTVFGAILSERVHCSRLFYGTGETCVFHWAPEFKSYDWTKKNSFFMFGSTNSFQIGGQSGRNAIWFDAALKYGRSEPTDTFDNPVLSGCLPAMRFASLTLDSSSPPPPPLGDEAERRQQGSADSGTTDESPPPPHSHLDSDLVDGIESVPFLIENMEVWELVS